MQRSWSIDTRRVPSLSSDIAPKGQWETQIPHASQRDRDTTGRTHITRYKRLLSRSSSLLSAGIRYGTDGNSVQSPTGSNAVSSWIRPRRIPAGIVCTDKGSIPIIRETAQSSAKGFRDAIRRPVGIGVPIAAGPFPSSPTIASVTVRYGLTIRSISTSFSPNSSRPYPPTK